MNLHSTIYGSSGPSVIILHGLFGMSDNWHSVARAIEGQYRVHVLDQRNHGKSPHASDMTYALLARDVEEYLDRLRIESAYVVGHSMGGKTAMQLALFSGERVAKLVIVDVSMRRYEPKHLHIFRAFETLPIGSYSSRKEVEEGLMSLLDDRTTVQFLMKNVGRGESGGYSWKIDHAAIRLNYENINAEIRPTAVFAGPALLIRGANSGYVTESDISSMTSVFSNLTFRTIEGAGHWVHADQPGLFVSALLDFLGAG